MSNRRRHENVLNFAPIATWTLLAVFACVGGLLFVHFKNQAHKRAEKISQLQRTLEEVRLADEAVRTRLGSLASPYQWRKLRAQDKSFLAGYVEIPSDRLTIVKDVASLDSELRPVSNEHR